VEVRRAQPEERPLVPVAAAQTDQQGSYVLTVGPDNKVRQQPVTLGRQVAQGFIVTKGLSGGEQVIVQGLQKVRPGEVVKPVPEPASGDTATAQADPSGPASTAQAGSSAPASTASAQGR
jgi:membrane fusion protein (multidrug efflux system)